ncbi:MAG TPA: ABC transporter ATP-binding protein [Polyangia bacterium]|nr:ABC transporter ATP-binding protein [Polyangia bacterium]
MAAVARVSQLEKRYGSQAVLRDVALTVDEGELVSLVGRSGSGKSTLLHILGGLDRRYTGSVEVLGRELAKLDDAGLANFRNREVGFIFQSFNLLDHLTVRENVALPAFFGAGPSPAARARADETLERVGVRDKADARPGELSGGQKQRVAIARALFGKPRLLLADEPTGNLDSDTGGQIIDLFRALNADGLTLIIVTHEERVSQAARRILRVDDGRILA